MSKKTVKKPARLANMELLRCIAMMMVVVLHYLGKGDILADLSVGNMTFHGLFAWVIECFCIVAVNVYMLISGYFSGNSSFKLSRLVKLYIQVWTYSVVIGFLAYFAGIYPAQGFSFHFVLTLILPITMGHYWFMTAYVFMYILMPLMGMAVRNLNEKQMRAALLILLFFNCFLKSIIPARLETDGRGYDFMWYICMFMTGAYIGKFCIGKISAWMHGGVIYLLGVLLSFVELMLLHTVYVKTGSLEHIMKISIEYNHIFVVMASVGLFVMFLNIDIKGKPAKIINKIAPHTLGVYLLHENFAVRYEWQKWLGSTRVDGVVSLIVSTIIAVVIVFAAGVTVDMLRAYIMGRLNGLLMKIKLYRNIVEKIEYADKIA